MDIKRMAQIKVAGWLGNAVADGLTGFSKTIPDIVNGKFIDNLSDTVSRSAAGMGLKDYIGNRADIFGKVLRDSMSDSANAITAEIGRQSEQAAKQLQVATLASGLLSGGGGLAGGLAAGGITGALVPTVNSIFNPGMDFNALPPEMKEKLNILVKRGL